MRKLRGSNGPSESPGLTGQRISLRPLTVEDFTQWNEVRTANEGWLTRWEPQRLAGQPDGDSIVRKVWFTRSVRPMLPML